MSIVLYCTQEKKSHGSCNGHFRGITYFDCEKDCAVFVALDKISLNSTTVGTAAPGITTSKSKQGLLLQQPIEQPQHQINRGNKVSVVGDNGDLVKGTVRWSGRNTGSQGNIVGIETVSHLKLICIVHSSNLFLCV